MESREGQTIPAATLRTRRAGAWHDVHTSEIFSGRTVIVFGLPGAFTPTCSSAHVPRYDQLAPVFAKHGVDEIVCVSVNDAFVMDAWAKDQDVEHVRFLPDGNAEFTRGMGMLVDKRDLGFGERSWRYSMLVKDGVIEKMFIEREVEGDPYEVSDADTMLRYLAGDDAAPPDILLFTKPGCGHCRRAKSMLSEAGLPYEEVAATPRRLAAVSPSRTTPAVFVDGEFIGGADELAQFLHARRG